MASGTHALSWPTSSSSACTKVSSGSGGMPTAFCAEWHNGDGPTIAGYAEYDAVPGNCQAADTVQRPREGLNMHAGGHTDPHSALGIGSLGGFLAARAMMEPCGPPPPLTSHHCLPAPACAAPASSRLGEQKDASNKLPQAGHSPEAVRTVAWSEEAAQEEERGA